MCGSATLAMEVSRTSMNVARVTVTAITQGLIEPSGIRSFDWILASMAIGDSSPRYLVALLRDYGRYYVHARTENRDVRRNRIENNLYGNALHDLDVVSGGVFRREQAKHRAGGSGNGINVPDKGLTVGVGFDVSLLARLHIAQLRFLEIGSDPNVLEGHDHQKTLAGLHDLAVFDGLMSGNTVHRSEYLAVAEVELSGVEGRARLI